MQSKSRPNTGRRRPFRTLRAGSLGPAVLVCEHASPALPPPADGSDSTLRRVLLSHHGWDPGAWEVSRALSDALGAPLVGARWSRLWVDLNRPPGHPELVRSEAEGVPLPWSRRLSAAALERRVREDHDPFHHEIHRILVRHRLRGQRPLVLAVHSFTPELRGRRRDFDAGVLHDGDEAAAAGMCRQLQARGLQVRINEPYSGLDGLMYAASRHGHVHGLPRLELEINQRWVEGRHVVPRFLRAVVEACVAFVGALGQVRGEGA